MLLLAWRMLEGSAVKWGGGSDTAYGKGNWGGESAGKEEKEATIQGRTIAFSVSYIS